MSRPRMGTAPRVRLNTTVAPGTYRAIESGKRPGESLGQVIDRAVEALKKIEPKGVKTPLRDRGGTARDKPQPGSGNYGQTGI